MFTIDVYNRHEFYEVLKGKDRFKDLDYVDYCIAMPRCPRWTVFININELCIAIGNCNKEIDSVSTFTINDQQMREIDRIKNKINFYEELIEAITANELPKRFVVTQNIHTKATDRRLYMNDDGVIYSIRDGVIHIED